MNKEYYFSYQLYQYIEVYLKKQRDLSSKTIETYKYGFLKFIYFLKSQKIDVENFNVKNITDELVMKFIEYLKENNNSSTTINLRISTISSFLDYVSTKIPSTLNNYRRIQNIKKLREKGKVQEYFTVEEVKRIMDEARENIKYLSILALLYDGALRVNELINIRINDVILEKNNPYIIIQNGKGNKSRVINLSKKLVEILKKYMKEINNQEYLFTNKYGSKYTSKGVTYILKKYWEKAKSNCNDQQMFNINPHCHMMRHSKGVHLVDDNVPLTVVKELLGHESIQTTEIYARISTKKRQEILENNSINSKINIKRSKSEISQLEEFLKSNQF